MHELAFVIENRKLFECARFVIENRKLFVKFKD